MSSLAINPPKMTKASTPLDTVNIPVVLLTVAIIASSFAFYYQSWNASTTLVPAELVPYDVEANKSAKYAESGNINAAISFLGLAFTGAFCCLFKTEKTLPIRNCIIFLLAFQLFWIVASLAWTTNLPVSIRRVPKELCVALSLYGLSRHLCLREIAWAIFGVSTCYITAGFIAEIYHGTFNPFWRYYRFVGTEHPNVLAVYAALIIVTGLMLFNRNAQLRWVLWSILLAAIAALLLTKSRTTLFALVAALTISGLLRAEAKWRILGLIAGSFLISTLGLAISIFNLWDRIGVAAAMGRTEHISSLTGRVPLWMELLKHAAERPWSGSGYGAFWDSRMIQRTSEIFLWEITHAHSVFLEALLNLGIIGMTAYVALLLSTLAISAKATLYTRRPEYQLVFTVTLFAMIHGIAEASFYSLGFESYALLFLIYRLCRECPNYDPLQSLSTSSAQRSSPIPNTRQSLPYKCDVIRTNDSSCTR
jgi:O-antigen ligase